MTNYPVKGNIQADAAAEMESADKDSLKVATKLNEGRHVSTKNV